MNPKQKTKWSAIALPLTAILLLGACAGQSSADTSATTSSNGGTASADSGASTVSSNFLGSYKINDAEFGTEVTVTVDGDTRTMKTNALPDTETGEFPNSGNPNTISSQSLTYSYPIDPNYVGNATEVRTTGVAINGVKFEPGTAESVTCASGETYRVEGLQDTYNLGMDFNNAHVQPTGEYHYHGVSDLMVDVFESDEDLVHVGFAADGFLMYYSKSGAYKPGYTLSTQERTGTDCTGSGALRSSSVDIEGTTPDGTYTSDWVFDEASGSLDRCNGTTVNGEYAYLITESYPFVGRCLNGEVSEERVGPPPGR
ncbi:MAG: YHYH protein [Actinobacteria bacterium]|nr:YHYH protein [Actinomycetota bacterium]